MTLDDLIERLTALRAEHGGHIGCAVVGIGHDGDGEAELVEGMVSVHVAAVESALLIDLTAG